MVRLHDGSFWVADEYGPSLAALDPTGHVTARYVPVGVMLPGAAYPVIAALPPAYAQRAVNRGFEALAISPDERSLFAVMQSPLALPDTRTTETARAVRILVFDIATRRPTAEYIYWMEDAVHFAPHTTTDQHDMKLAAAYAFDHDQLLIVERNDDTCSIYRIDLRGATDIATAPWQQAHPRATIETTADLALLDIIPVRKTPLFQSTARDGIPAKIEGLAVIDRTHVILANDNDFDVGPLDGAGRSQGSGEQSHLVVLAFTTPIDTALPTNHVP